MKIKKWYQVEGDQNNGKRLVVELDNIGLGMTSSETLEKPNHEFDFKATIPEALEQLTTRDNIWTERSYLIPNPDKPAYMARCTVFYPSVAIRTTERMPQVGVQYFEEGGMPTALEETLGKFDLTEID